MKETMIVTTLVAVVAMAICIALLDGMSHFASCKSDKKYELDSSSSDGSRKRMCSLSMRPTSPIIPVGIDHNHSFLGLLTSLVLFDLS
jgi:hypothetical protein